ncbi:hypothetical protein B0H13DRAFT_2654879 [Mycena leptocephala]|nr:hypothetical protein B0H13DRAFT_2654879 [Mycena leptocephala]
MAAHACVLVHSRVIDCVPFAVHPARGARRSPRHQVRACPKYTSSPPSPCKLSPIVEGRVLHTLGASGERTHGRERAEAKRGTLLWLSQLPSVLDIFSASRYPLTCRPLNAQCASYCELMRDCRLSSPGPTHLPSSLAGYRGPLPPTYLWPDPVRRTSPRDPSFLGTWTPLSVESVKRGDVVLVLSSPTCEHHPLTSTVLYCTPSLSDRPPPSGIVAPRAWKPCPQHGHPLPASSPSPATRADAADVVAPSTQCPMPTAPEDRGADAGLGSQWAKGPAGGRVRRGCGVALQEPRWVLSAGGGVCGSAPTLLFDPVVPSRSAGGGREGVRGGGAGPPVQPVVASWRRGRRSKCAEGQGATMGECGASGARCTTSGWNYRRVRAVAGVHSVGCDDLGMLWHGERGADGRLVETHYVRGHGYGARPMSRANTFGLALLTQPCCAPVLLKVTPDRLPSLLDCRIGIGIHIRRRQAHGGGRGQRVLLTLPLLPFTLDSCSPRRARHPFPPLLCPRALIHDDDSCGVCDPPEPADRRMRSSEPLAGLTVALARSSVFHRTVLATCVVSALLAYLPKFGLFLILPFLYICFCIAVVLIVLPHRRLAFHASKC